MYQVEVKRYDSTGILTLTLTRTLGVASDWMLSLVKALSRFVRLVFCTLKDSRLI